MYASQYDSVTFTFEASGSLWRDAVVLLDRQTGSLWNQVYGRALEGPRYGMELELYPSEFLSFKALKEKYPNARLLAKPDKGDNESHYKKYFEDPSRLGIFGRTYESDVMGVKDTVLGLRFGIETTAIPISGVSKSSIALATFADVIAVISYEPETDVAHAFVIDRDAAESGELKITETGEILLNGETRSIEDLVGGAAKQLGFERAALQTSFWGPWKSFFPNTSITRLE